MLRNRGAACSGTSNQHKARDGVIGLACWAHARRYFDKALDSDRERATIALNLIQRLYAVEREARDGDLSCEARKELRLDKALPVINLLGNWLAGQIDDTLPKSPIGKAVRYAVRLWDELQAYLYDGRLEIDNNLIENAIKYNKPGGSVTVGIKPYTEDEKRVLVYVKDTGIGIDQKYIDRVTERFFRVDKSRSREKGGTGLGLAIVKHIMEAHGERFFIESTPNVGSTFSFTLTKVESTQAVL